MIKITLVTVCYNDSDKLQETIDNVKELKCKYKGKYNISYLIKDGLSTDNTKNIIEYPAVDNYFSSIDHGIYDAMNFAWGFIEPGEYVLFLGAGDKLIKLPDVIESDVLIGTTFIGKRKFKSNVSILSYLGNTVHHQSFLIKKTDMIPSFNIKFKRYADFDLIQKLLLINKLSYSSSDSFIAYADPDGVTSKLNVVENVKVVFSNFGFIVSFFSLLYCLKNKLLEYINSFR